jgi:transglutaminase superfamily protein
MTEQLYLSEDVYVCMTEGHGVFLDLKRDKYSAVMFPTPQEASGQEAPNGAPVTLAQKLAAQRDELLQAGLLTKDPVTGRPIEGAPIEGVQGHIFGLDDQRAFGLTGEAAAGLNITFGEMWDFFTASWQASRDLKGKHIAMIVENVRRRKAKVGGQASNLEKVRRLTAVYRRLRPWYPRKYLCLYDSLALVKFMAKRKVYPLWVFAVQAQPFGAHCWVQNERLLLNEGSEYAGQFTPIMAI